MKVDNRDVLISGSIVHWDIVKMKHVEQFGIEIDKEYF